MNYKNIKFDDYLDIYMGTPVVVVPDIKKQNKTHKKKRINKKWAKRYGYMKYSRVEDDKIFVLNDKVYVNERTYIKMKTYLNLV